MSTPAWRPDRAIGSLALAAAELGWLLPLAVGRLLLEGAAMDGGALRPSAGWLVGALLAGAASHAVAGRSRLPPARAARAMALLGGGAALVAGLTWSKAGAVLVAAAWWRGTVLAGPVALEERARAALPWGLAGLAAGGALGLVTGVPAVRAAAYLAGGLVVGGGLLALAMARFEALARRPALDGRAGSPAGRWAPFAVALSGGIVLGAIGLSLLASTEAADLVVSLLAPVRLVGEWLLTALATLIMPLLMVAVRLVLWLVMLARGSTERAEWEEPPPPPADEVLVRDPAPWVFELGRWLGFLAFVAGLVLLIARAFGRPSLGTAEPGVVEERDRLPARPWFRLPAGLGRKRRLLPLLGRSPADLVRQAYLWMLEEAGRMGTPRLSPETPLEFSARVGRTVPAAGPSLEELTGLYVAVRYGDESPPSGVVVRARSLARAVVRSLAEPRPEPGGTADARPGA